MGKFSKLKTAKYALSERSTPSVATLDQYAYVFGGVKDDFRARNNTFYNDLHRFDTKNNVWEKLTPVNDPPSARGFASAVGDKRNEHVLLFGGANYTANFSSIIMYDELWIYSPSKNTWIQIKPSKQIYIIWRREF